jgi:hypothetical protein
MDVDGEEEAAAEAAEEEGIFWGEPGPRMSAAYEYLLCCVRPA